MDGCKAKIIDAQETGLPDNFYTHVIMNLGYQTIPQTLKALKDGAWENRLWVIETLEKQGLIDVKAVVHPMLRWNKVQEFMDSTFPITMSMFPLKLWTEGDREKYGPLLVPVLKKFLLDKYGNDSPFDLRIAITATAMKSSEN
ncbi:hypothetical protein ACHAPC_000154 [Botrytis cinerea]